MVFDAAKETGEIGKTPSLAGRSLWRAQWLRAWRRRLHLARAALGDWARADTADLSVWVPVAIGCGIGFYFGLKSEPPWQAGIVALTLAGLTAMKAPHLRFPAMAAAFAAMGFVAADWRTAQVHAPSLDRDLGIVSISGRLVSVDEGPSSRRMVIELSTIHGVSAAATPDRARISWRGSSFAVQPGDLVTMRVGLRPPPPPAAPGTFDFARQLYFQRIGAVGFAVSPPRLDARAPNSRAQQWSALVERMRNSLFLRITTAAPSEGGAIVAAIVTGKREAISERAENALRDAGLAHLLAISGLHMGLATGLIFFVVRLALALIEPLALRYPIKKWAACAALSAGLFYLVLSGGGWSARRAFIMAAIMFTAIVFDRRALSLRNVAIAAVIILLTTPEALFHPGFQMSFAAVTALIAGFEWASRRANPFRSFSWAARLKRYALGLAATDLIAAIATAPFALYHFNRVALYSLPANVVAMPLMGFLVAPMAVTALSLAPLGLDAWAWRASAMGMEAILAIAIEVSSWRGAVSITAQWPLSALLFLTFGGLWMCLSRAPWRAAGLMGIPAAWAVVTSAVSPTLFVASSGLNAGIVLSASHDGRMAVYNRRRDRFSVGVWKEAIGQDFERKAVEAMHDVLNCDRDGCVTSSGADQTTIVSFLSERRALDEDCARADLVIAFFPVWSSDWAACGAILIDRYSVWNQGAHAVWIEKGKQIRIKTVSQSRGARPWTGG